MKKRIALLLIAACLLTSLFSCGSKCKHEWGNQELSVYVCERGDCDTPYVYYKSCTKCGLRNSSETFVATATRGHSWVEGERNEDTLHSAATCVQAAKYKKVCRVCGEISDTETYSYGSALGHDWREIPSAETFVGNPDCTHGNAYKATCANGCTSEPPIFYLGSPAPHADTHAKDENGLCVENGAECDVCDDVCDSCDKALKDYEGVDTDNKTDIDLLG